MRYLTYDEWKKTSQGKAAIEQALNTAKLRAEYARQMREAKFEHWREKYYQESSERAREEGLNQLLGPNGAVDDDYIVELPIDIGYNITSEGFEVMYASLGGHNVLKYLPPDVIEEINARIQTYGEEHGLF